LIESGDAAVGTPTTTAKSAVRAIGQVIDIQA
jgi:hypothetical protein